MSPKFLLLLSFLALGWADAHGAPRHVLTAVPRAVARTADNMVTFKDRNLAFHQWALIGGALAGAGSSVNLYHRCPTCTELDTFFYGQHPSAGRVFSLELLGAMTFSTIQQAFWESSRNEEHSRTLQTFERWTPTAAPIIGYAWCVYHNVRVPSDGN